MNNFDVAIIGGGIHGCSVALYISKLGFSCAVFEKDHVGRHASGVNAGGVRRLGRAFQEIPIADLSSQIWHKITDLTDDDCGFKMATQIKVAESHSDLRKLEKRIKAVKKLGYNHERLLSYRDLYSYLPNLAPHCFGGAIVEGDGYANPYRTTQAFKRKATKLGAKFFENTEVSSIDCIKKDWVIKTTNNRYVSKYVVNCAGAWGQKIATFLGDSVPIYAHAPMLMITSRLPRFLNAVVGSQSRALSFKQFSNGSVLIGGGYLGRVKLDRNETELDFKKLSENVQTARSLFPIISKATIVRTWAGIEGFTQDDLPVIGPGRKQGVYHAFGFSAHGFQMAPGVGKIVSDLIANRQNDYSLDAFRVERFTNMGPRSSLSEH